MRPGSDRGDGLDHDSVRARKRRWFLQTRPHGLCSRPFGGTGTAGGPTNKLSFKFSATAAGIVQGTWVIKANTGQTINGTVAGDNIKGIKTQDKTGKYSYTMLPLTGCGTATVTGKLVNGSPGALTPVIWSAQKT